LRRGFPGQDRGLHAVRTQRPSPLPAVQGPHLLQVREFPPDPLPLPRVQIRLCRRGVAGMSPAEPWPPLGIDMNHRRGKLLFGVWFGLFLPPITIGAIVLSFATSPYLGIVTVAVLGTWIYETAHTTCCRCWAYGTAGCGMPSLVAPWLSARESP